MRYGWIATAVVVLSFFTSAARAEVKTETVKYKAGDVEAQGFLAYDAGMQGKRPGVLVVPEWWGLNDYPKMRAQQLAKLGYVAFVADIYGEGKTTEDPKQSGAWSGALKGGDRAKLRERVAAAFEQLKGNPNVDASKTAAIGYCFGGTTVLELARAGADVQAVVAFHPDPSPPQGAPADRIKAKVLACIGAVDPFVPQEAIDEFKKEMETAKADWALNIYGGAVHAFTNPNADKHNIPGVAYHKQADMRSWQAMLDLFNETFGQAGNNAAQHGAGQATR